MLPQHSVGQRNLLGYPCLSRFVVGIPWVLFVYPFWVSRCNIYLEKKEIMINSSSRSSRFDRFKMAVVCMLRQNSRWRVLMTIIMHFCTMAAMRTLSVVFRYTIQDDACLR